MAKRMQPHFVTLTVELDRSGGPERGLVHITDLDCITIGYERAEFAPFDSLCEVNRWFTRTVRKYVPIRPG